MAKIKLLDFWAPWCIDPQTPVLTESGYLVASKIQVGMQLMTVDPITKGQSLKKVRKIRIFKDVQSKKVALETGRELIGDINHLVLTQEGFKKLQELKVGEKILVDPSFISEMNQVNERSVILARLLGFVMTDGYLYEDLKHHIHETHFFVGTNQDVEEIKRDLQSLGFNKLKVEKRSNNRVINDREFIITTFRCRNFEKSLFELLRSYGAPVGRKKNQEYFIPDWIMDGDTIIKRAFLSGWLGGDGCKITYQMKHGGISSHDARFNVNAIEFHKEKYLEKEGILYAKQLGLLLEQLGVMIKDISSSDDEDGVIISIRVATDYQSLFNLASISYAYANTKNNNVPFIREFLQYRLLERNNYIQAKQIVLQQLALGVSNSQIAQSLQIPIGTVYSWGHVNRDTKVVYPPKSGETLFTKWLEQRQQGDLLWEKVANVSDVKSRDVIGITVNNPHTIITNGIISHNCGPCRIMNPIIDEIEKEIKGIEVERINVDESPEMASKYGVMSIPTYVIEKDGKEVGRKIGVTAKSDLVALLK